MDSLAEAPPAAAGANVIGTSVDAPAARVVVAGDPAENCAAPVPEIPNGGSSVTAKALVFVIVTGSVEGEPAMTTPNARLVGAAVSVAAAMPMVYAACPEQPFASVARMVTEKDLRLSASQTQIRRATGAGRVAVLLRKS